MSGLNSKEIKPSLRIEGKSLGGTTASITWDEATMTWDEATFTWNTLSASTTQPSSLGSKEIKPNASSKEIKL